MKFIPLHHNYHLSNTFHLISKIATLYVHPQIFPSFILGSDRGVAALNELCLPNFKLYIYVTGKMKSNLKKKQISSMQRNFSSQITVSF